MSMRSLETPAFPTQPRRQPVSEPSYRIRSERNWTCPRYSSTVIGFLGSGSARTESAGTPFWSRNSQLVRFNARGELAQESAGAGPARLPALHPASWEGFARSHEGARPRHITTYQNDHPTEVLTPKSFLGVSAGGELSKFSKKLKFQYRLPTRSSFRLVSKFIRTRPPVERLGNTANLVVNSVELKRYIENSSVPSPSALLCRGSEPDSGENRSVFKTTPPRLDSLVLFV